MDTFTKGATVEVFSERHNAWCRAEVVSVWKGRTIPEGRSFVEYGVACELDGVRHLGLFNAEYVRRAGRDKHSTRVLRANRVKKGN